MIFGLSRDGRLYIFFDMPFALQIGNGVRWWTNGPGHLGDGKDYIGIIHTRYLWQINAAVVHM